MWQINLNGSNCFSHQIGISFIARHLPSSFILPLRSPTAPCSLHWQHLPAIESAFSADSFQIFFFLLILHITSVKQPLKTSPSHPLPALLEPPPPSSGMLAINHEASLTSPLDSSFKATLASVSIRRKIKWVRHRPHVDVASDLPAQVAQMFTIQQRP